MFTNNSINETVYILPEDGDVAKKNLLELFDDPDIDSVYINAYGITLSSLAEKIKKLDSNGIHVEILSDYVQSRGKTAWAIAKDIHENLKFGSITLTTAGINSDNPGAIYHHKNITFRFKNKPAINFMGSANFSSGSWSQGNVCQIFESQEFSDKIVEYFKAHKEWALKNRYDKQVDSEFESLSDIDDIDESNEDLYDLIGKQNKEIDELKNKILFFKYVILILFIIFLFMKISQ